MLAPIRCSKESRDTAALRAKARKHRAYIASSDQLSNLWMAVVKEVAETMAAARMAKFPERLGLDLADTLPGNSEMLAHFFKRMFAAVLQPESHFDNLLLAWAQRLQDFGGLLTEGSG